MLDFRLASVCMAVLTSNLVIIILTIIFLNDTILYKFGFSILGVFCILTFVRMALPFELVRVAITIKMPAVFSKVLVYIQHPNIPLLGHMYSIWELFLYIWGIVFLILFFRYIHSIKETYDFVQTYGTYVTDYYNFLIDRICTKKILQKKISVVKLPMIPSPYTFKCGLHYYILIPANLKLDEEEEELIFRHELSHVMHHDLTLQFLVQALCLFYWWNPFCLILRKQSNLLFELRVDSSVLAKGHEKTERYLLCLLKVRKYSITNESKLPPSSIISFLPKDNSALNKRFRFLMQNNSIKNKWLKRLVLMPICILYLVSFIFIFEAYYRLPESFIESDIALTSQNMYIVKNNKDKYDIYFNGIYAETVNSLENYPKNCKIYLSLKEAQKNEKN